MEGLMETTLGMLLEVFLELRIELIGVVLGQVIHLELNLWVRDAVWIL